MNKLMLFFASLSISVLFFINYDITDSMGIIPQAEPAEEITTDSATELNDIELNLNSASFEFDGVLYTKYTGKPWFVSADGYPVQAAEDTNNNLVLCIAQDAVFSNIALVKSKNMNDGTYNIYCKEGYTLEPPSENNINAIVVDVNQNLSSPQRFIVEDSEIAKLLADALNRENKSITELISYICTIHFINEDNMYVHVSVEIYKTETEYYLFNTVDYTSTVLDQEEIDHILAIIE